MKPLLRGIFLTSEMPEATARFYRDVVGLELEQIGNPGGYIYWKVDKDGLQIAIHDAARFAEYTHPARHDSNVTHLYFKIENQPQFLEHLNRLSIDAYATDDVVITLTDPDGRKVMFGTA
jgi:catechol 2,3-dioxygenase-like lactoylglutathione lyase family enzyme